MKITFVAMGGMAALLLMAANANAQFSDDSGDNEPLTQVEEKYGYILESSIWRSTDIQVCWENENSQFSKQRANVKDVIEKTWERYSKLDFKGWGKCPTNNFVGIRIKVADAHPHVKELGSYISGLKNGMVLNFTYGISDFKGCQSDTTMYQLCNRSIAVHEFGHAIGFSHEHNRKDRDGSCLEPAQGTHGDKMLTPYDPDSVMNYCNPKYNNFGKLSFGDIVSVQKVYGKPE